MRDAQREVRRRVHQLKRLRLAEAEEHQISNAKAQVRESSNALRSIIRTTNLYSHQLRDEKLFTILSSDPRKLYKAIKSNKKSNSPKLPFLSVNIKCFEETRFTKSLIKQHLP